MDKVQTRHGFHHMWVLVDWVGPLRARSMLHPATPVQLSLDPAPAAVGFTLPDGVRVLKP
ncbi:hypothetical protein ACGF1Z_29815 [Streptomyces sp. NPDC048018]|uniref:hypothetical protein n=1 Tax=Streptomyces sp. NPDC048018 TaxID=3365499 RepID=UPI0037202FF3